MAHIPMIGCYVLKLVSGFAIKIIRLNVRHLGIAMILLFGNMNRYLPEIFCEQENTDDNKHNIAMVNMFVVIQATRCVVSNDLGPEKFSSDDSRIHDTCHWHGYNCIKEFLSDLQLQKLRESCFGYLFDLDESLKPAQMIMHSLLLHQECNSNGNELQLSFNSNKVKFSIAEFGIITGLNCNEFPPDSDIIEHPNRLLNKYFSGNESISRKELAECLMKT
ncbi:hypothetical protein F8388_005589 [Cannabis sativa]|uniref:DUF1985 domain-containing protein n=1 Tax=Cannabis sativa TaxID=3483 RepID=A0A7J6GYD3_CANSA|nr:hypothetical protein F8388_005589 [Cannabis sativa]